MGPMAMPESGRVRGSRLQASCTCLPYKRVNRRHRRHSERDDRRVRASCQPAKIGASADDRRSLLLRSEAPLTALTHIPARVRVRPRTFTIEHALIRDRHTDTVIAPARNSCLSCSLAQLIMSLLVHSALLLASSPFGAPVAGKPRIARRELRRRRVADASECAAVCHGPHGGHGMEVLCATGALHPRPTSWGGARGGARSVA